MNHSVCFNSGENFYLFRLNKKMVWPGFELALMYSFMQHS